MFQLEGLPPSKHYMTRLWHMTSSSGVSSLTPSCMYNCLGGSLYTFWSMPLSLSPLYKYSLMNHALSPSLPTLWTTTWWFVSQPSICCQGIILDYLVIFRQVLLSPYECSLWSRHRCFLFYISTSYWGTCLLVIKRPLFAFASQSYVTLFRDPVQSSLSFL